MDPEPFVLKRRSTPDTLRYLAGRLVPQDGSQSSDAAVVSVAMTLLSLAEEMDGGEVDGEG
jgi:hypothetical protein